MSAKNNVITSYELNIDGIRYFVCIRHYDGEHYTADWWGDVDRQKRELGYGLGQCGDAERAVERSIRQQHRGRTSETEPTAAVATAPRLQTD